MPRASPFQTSFNAGELSPDLAGRIDLDKYASGVKRLDNFVPLVQGPIERRPGTHHVAEVKQSVNRTMLIDFVFSQDAAYAIELGGTYARFYTNRGVVLSAGIPYEIAGPFQPTDLFDANGIARVSYTQSNDVMFMANRGYFPQVLERFAPTNWAFRQFGLPASGSFTAAQYAYQWPFGNFNSNTTKAIYASATTGSVTLNATASVFESWMVGYLILLESSVGSAVPAWEPAKAVVVGDERRVDSRVYVCTVAGTTGTVRPTHTEGARADGDPGASWQFLHPGYGVAQITGYTSGATVTASVVTPLPSDVVGGANATRRWALTAWNTVDGMPTVVAFFAERLWWFRGTQGWASVAGDFFNYAERDNGEVLPDSAISFTLASATADNIVGATPTESGLLLRTEGAEWVLSAITGEPLGPGNFQIKPQSSNGSRPIRAIGVQEAVLYVQDGGQKVREAVFSIEDNVIKSRDITVLATHLTKPGVVGMALQTERWPVLWSHRSDGRLLAFGYNREQNVYGWAPQTIGGAGAVEAVIVIPSPGGASDDLWMIVNRTIGGNTKRYVEYMDQGFGDDDEIRNAWFVDSGLAYLGTPVTSLTGLTHLAGQLVDVLTDGAAHRQVLVSAAGGITLDWAASRVIVGLPAPCLVEMNRPVAGASDGSIQGKTKRTHSMTWRFKNTVGGKAGPNESTLDELQFRGSNVPMNEAVPPFTGDMRMLWPGGYETDGYAVYVNDQPLPVTIVAATPTYVTQEK